MALRVAIRYVKNSAEAEDLAQETLIRAWRNRNKLRDPEGWEAWLARIARNEVMRALERKIPLPAEVEEVGEEDSRLDDLLESAEMETALASLSESERQILHLRYAEDLTQPAVAERLGIPEGTAKAYLSRARQKLAEHLRSS